jgi:hypothetical protein
MKSSHKTVGTKVFLTLLDDRGSGYGPLNNGPKTYGSGSAALQKTKSYLRVLPAHSEQRSDRFGERPGQAPLLQNNTRQLVTRGQLLQLLFCRG